MSMASNARVILRRRWVRLALLFAVGALVFLPAILSPPWLDDYFQASMIEGTYPAPRSPFDLYDFVGDADRGILLERGLLPWWAHPRLTVRFLRPLSSALLYTEHHLLGRSFLLFHLHSFVWWALAASVCFLLYRTLFGERPAILAAFIFALAPCHALPLVWLANREVLISITFGVLGLFLLVRFRESARAHEAALSAVLFSFALAGGEYALCFAGYVFALTLAPGRSRRPSWVRALTFLSFAIPAATYLVIRARLGFGTEGSGFYHDPFRDPRTFLASAPRRLVTLLLEVWFTVAPEAVSPLTSLVTLAIFFVAGALFLVTPVRRVIAGLAPEPRAHARWLALGSLFSLAPVLAVGAFPRVLGASLIGVAAIVALVLDRAWWSERGGEAARNEPGEERLGITALILGFLHLVHGPGSAWITSRVCNEEAHSFVTHAETLRTRVTDPEHQEVVLVRGLGGALYTLPYALNDRGLPPLHWRMLAVTGHMLVKRIDPETLEVIIPKSKRLFPSGEGDLFRGEAAPFLKGDVINLPGMRVTVLDIGDYGPDRVRFEFDGALESPQRVWVADGTDGLRDAPPPQPGFGQPFDR